MKNVEPNLQSLPGRSADAKRIKNAFNPVPETSEVAAEFRKLPPLSDEELANAWKQLAIDTIPHGAEGDERLMCYTGEPYLPTGFPLLNEKLRSMPFISVSTPSGRISPTYMNILERQTKEAFISGFDANPSFDMSHYETHVHQREVLAFNRGIHAAAMGGKSGMAFELLRLRIEKLKNDPDFKPVFICHEPQFDFEIVDTASGASKIGLKILQRYLERCMDVRAHVHIKAIRAAGGNQEYETLKLEYQRLAEGSKLKDEARHEFICKTLLRDMKKRRKAYRKLLDFIRDEVNGNRDSESDARTGTNKRRSPNITGLSRQGRGVFNRY